MDKEKIRALAIELKEVMDLGIEVLKKYGVAEDPITSIAISADGYMSIAIQDEPWDLVRCGGEENARLRIEEEV